MRLIALGAVVFACVVFTAVSNESVHAETTSTLEISQPLSLGANLTIFEQLDEAAEAEPAETETTEPPVIKHTVRPAETLTDIAEEHDTTWRRLFDKNTALADPNILNVGMTLVIPAPDEKLKERKVPVAKAPAPTRQTTATTRKSAPRPARRVRGATAGNRYIRGYCTWYAKNRRPDLPNNLGNANTWVARAAAQGIPTGSTPKAGAIGQQGMHVVYVERVNGDGTVTVSEMNYKGLGVISSRTVPASSFKYIY